MHDKHMGAFLRWSVTSNIGSGCLGPPYCTYLSHARLHLAIMQPGSAIDREVLPLKQLALAG